MNLFKKMSIYWTTKFLSQFTSWFNILSLETIIHQLNNDAEVQKLQHAQILKTVNSQNTALCRNNELDLRKSQMEAQVLQNNISSLDSKVSE